MRFNEIFNSFEELSIGGLLLLLAMATTFQVITRYCFDITFDWMAEGSRYLTILATFAGAGLAVKSGAHFTMDAAIHFLPERPTLLVKSIAHFFSSFIMFIVGYQAYVLVKKLALFGMSTASLGLPMWVAYLPILFFSLVIGWRFFHEGIKSLRAFINPASAS
ncbi:TRAP transporter small permease [Maridesulfovibrio zosterae]|uniref:TRAP transporter small permease n=1 Tax=Maridesulfovibrio zosterae TaxID=82171 RepID=UPI0004072266|nr:TRAP transporter small permease [Maridesulfovibrio zosterae]